MSRSAIAAFLVVCLGVPIGAVAQEHQVTPDANDISASARSIVGATAGSAAGFVWWWRTGGPYTNTGDSLGRLWLGTTLGSVVGAWASADRDRRPDLARLLVGASYGVIGGAVLTLVTASTLDGPNSEAPGALLVLSFSVGQAGVIQLVGF